MIKNHPAAKNAEKLHRILSSFSQQCNGFIFEMEIFSKNQKQNPHDAYRKIIDFYQAKQFFEQMLASKLEYEQEYRQFKEEMKKSFSSR